MADVLQYADRKTLLDIIDCKSYDQLNKILGDVRRNKLIAELSFNRYLKKDTTSLIESLASALTFAQLPIQLLWLIIAFVSLGVAGLWVFGGVGLVAGALLIGFGVRYFKKQYDKMRQVQHELIYMGIKNQALDILIQQQDPSIQYVNALSEDSSIDKNEAAELGTFFGLNLLFTFWGTRDILMTVGLLSASSLIAGPIGLAIAAGVTLLLGVSFAVHHYYFQKKNAPIESLKKSLEEEIKEKETILRTLKPEVKKTIIKFPETKEENIPEPLSPCIPVISSEANSIPMLKLAPRFFKKVEKRDDPQPVPNARLTFSPTVIP